MSDSSKNLLEAFSVRQDDALHREAALRGGLFSYQEYAEAVPFLVDDVVEHLMQSLSRSGSAHAS